MNRLEQATRRLEQAVTRLESAARRGGDGKASPAPTNGGRAGPGDMATLVAARLDDAIARLNRLLDS